MDRIFSRVKILVYLFVYGSLRYGFELHHILKNSRYIGLGYIEGYKMYDLGHYPGIIRGDGIVWGEVYEIDYDTLNFLDEVEDYRGTQEDLYIREKTTVYFDTRRKFKLNDVYVYIYNQPIIDREEIINGDYSSWVGMPILVNYFAYAENTNLDILRQRGVNKILKEIKATLLGYRMIFNVPCKYGVCANLIEDSNGKICGYIYQLTLDSINSLDKAEEHLIKYVREMFKVIDENGKEYYAIGYVYKSSENQKEPKLEYINIILKGLSRLWKNECISSGLENYFNENMKVSEDK